MLTAITRHVSPRLAECELSYQDRRPIGIALAREQHAAYRAALADLGVNVVCLPAEPDLPDSVFVEDPIVVLDEVAIVTRPGAESRRPESASLAQALAPYRELCRIEPPATLEGGDVLRAGKTLYVGFSKRTNFAGIQQLAQLVHPFGYWVTPVQVRGCLHLKTACCFLGGNVLLANRNWIDLDAFCGIRFLDAPDPAAANVLRIGETILIPSAYPATRALLESEGHAVRPLDISEFIKAEAGLTCLSVLFDA